MPVFFSRIKMETAALRCWTGAWRALREFLSSGVIHFVEFSGVLPHVVLVQLWMTYREDGTQIWVNALRRTSYNILPVCGHLEQSRQLRSSRESRDLPLDDSALRLQLCALIGAAQLLRQTKVRTVNRRVVSSAGIQLVTWSWRHWPVNMVPKVYSNTQTRFSCVQRVKFHRKLVIWCLIKLTNLIKTPAAADPPPIPDLHVQNFKYQMKITFFCSLIC